MENEHEELRLLKEALWCSRWSMVFAVAALAVEVIALIEIFRDNLGRVFALMALAVAVYLFARYLGSKSQQYRHKADEVSDD